MSVERDGSVPPEGYGATVPVTMLSGFLGAGKTTLLKHVLENSKIKIACVVNDVAEVNIDAKLVRNTNGGGSSQAVTDMVELQNGCACCSAADELFPAFAQILEMGQRRGEPFDRIILENSGVAEPQSIRDSFTEALSMGHPVLDHIHLANLITVVDSATFIQDFSSRAPLAMRPDLGEGGTMRPVVDLLVEQIECADVVVLNKIDMVDAHRVESLPPIVASMNPLARVLSCSHGKIPVEVLEQAGIISRLNVEAQHRCAVVAVKEENKESDKVATKTGQAAKDGKSHSHEGHDHSDHAVGDKTRSHDHDHHHHHGTSADKAHSHDHSNHTVGDHHHHGSTGDKEEHSHEHDHHHHDHNDHHHDHGPTGDKEEHSHEHDHHHHDHHDHHHDHHDHHHDHGPRAKTTAEKRFGIRSFVYRSRIPFHPLRLRELVLRWLPCAQNKALEGQAPAEGDRPIKKVLRSKGFVWLSNNHITAFYWSHAGQHFELREEGDWWAAVGESDWPEEQGLRDVVLSDFEGEFGDRRQEIVFIGANMDEEKINDQLNEALLTPTELKQYVDNWAAYPDPPNPGKTART